MLIDNKYCFTCSQNVLDFQTETCMCACILVGSQFESHGMRTLKNRHMEKIHIQERGRATARPASFSSKGIVNKVMRVLHIMVVLQFQVNLTSF